jgi:hypothetical protein
MSESILAERVLSIDSDLLRVAVADTAMLHSKKADGYCLECMVVYPCQYTCALERMIRAIDSRTGVRSRFKRG